MDYFWIYVLAVIAVVAIIVFVATFSQDMTLSRKLKLKKTSLLVNFSLLMISLSSVGLIIYLFVLIRGQIVLLG